MKDELNEETFLQFYNNYLRPNPDFQYLITQQINYDYETLTLEAIIADSANRDRGTDLGHCLYLVDASINHLDFFWKYEADELVRAINNRLYTIIAINKFLEAYKGYYINTKYKIVHWWTHLTDSLFLQEADSQHYIIRVGIRCGNTYTINIDICNSDATCKNSFDDLNVVCCCKNTGKTVIGSFTTQGLLDAMGHCLEGL